MNPIVSICLDSATEDPSQQEIAVNACELWAQAGRPEGIDQSFWFEAERQLNEARPVPDINKVTLKSLGKPVPRSQKGNR